MKQNNIAFIDFETTGLSKKCQLTQVAIVVLDGRTLEFSKNDVFSSKIWIEQDEEKCVELDVEPISEKVLKLTHNTREELLKAPKEEIVWEKMLQFLKRYNNAGQWGRPIMAGFNITNYDRPLFNLRAEKYGQWDPIHESNKVFHPREIIDLQKFMYLIVESFPTLNSMSMDSMRQLFGFPDTGMSHDARVDVIEGALLLQRMMRWLRKLSSKKKFEGVMASANVKDFM
jgi:DNA polymerase III epsilon subunit-like protein